MVVTFDPHPMTVVHPDSAPPRLTTLEHRLELLEQCGVDAVLVLPFTRELSLWEPAEFVRRVLVDALHAVEVHVGENFRFGHRATGDVTTLARRAASGRVHRGGAAAGRRHQPLVVDVRPAVPGRGRRREPRRALGRPHRVEGPVVEGDKRGRELGYPTANLDLPPAPRSRPTACTPAG